MVQGDATASVKGCTITCMLVSTVRIYTGWQEREIKMGRMGSRLGGLRTKMKM